ncbi:DUF1707 domain-containing protein [Streptomyces alfalfae]|uniref:DUF1707 domain-containing protein n=1 Tax=Streptomyces alfalfae TaxID=1642299 RepID=A0A1P8TKD9_9ACTN|nr:MULTISPECIES: DUF1707 domain-containing protein [Streptomyces]AYA18477.1 DUF1707 domain-containing protein [Streptomyces fradiae]APY88096.1 hypothetical protein A7J05_22480 [Streptomyces alfalfae]KUL54048.1 hypothetical protein ADL30_18085 [Streptomyces sp. NRRL S-1521]QQC89493.1 DUF1707 domain-containing protein [Streptomyces alfalfae]QUI31933.1 DUF1707 domain-containing protein [Streptomyces alfalfae]
MSDAASSGGTPHEPAGPRLPDLRASDADRERVAEQLRDAMAEGRLDMTEFEERLDATYKARTYGELEPITSDLPSHGAKVSMVKRQVGDDDPAGVDWARRMVDGEPTSTGGFALWSGFSRKGGWTIGRQFTAFAMWGGGEIDLREAYFADRDVEIRCFTIMGGLQVIVPPELNVTVKGFGIMGGVDDEATGLGTPGSPRVVVKGYALMGGVGVERKLRRAEKLRIKEERRLERLERRERRRAAHWERSEQHRVEHEERHELQMRGHEDILDEHRRQRERRRERD